MRQAERKYPQRKSVKAVQKLKTRLKTGKFSARLKDIRMTLRWTQTDLYRRYCFLVANHAQKGAEAIPLSLPFEEALKSWKHRRSDGGERFAAGNAAGEI